jgi:hypothetical protein
MQAQLNPLAANRIKAAQGLEATAANNPLQAAQQRPNLAGVANAQPVDQFQGVQNAGLNAAAPQNAAQNPFALFANIVRDLWAQSTAQTPAQGALPGAQARAGVAAPQGPDVLGAANAPQAALPGQNQARPGDQLPQPGAQNPMQQMMGVIKGLVGVIAGLVGILGQLLKGKGLPGANPQAQQAGKPQAQTAGGALNPEAKDVKWAAQHGKYKWEGDQLKINGGEFKGCTGKYDAEAKTMRIFNEQGDHVANQKVDKESNGKPKVASPLALDINGEKGIQTSDKKVNFDIDGDGKLDQVNDVQEGVLAFGEGKNGKQLFGDNTDLDGDGKADGYKNGFEALRALAKKEGMYDEKAGDTKLDAGEIATLEKKYNFGLKKGYNAETESLAQNGVTEIELGSENARTTARQGDQKDVILQEQEGATFKQNGETKEYADVWHRI